MIRRNVELHGIEDLYTTEGQEGVWLQRVPESLRAALNPSAQAQVRSPGSAEIRFVADGPAKVTLASQDETRVSVFYGGFGSDPVITVGTAPQTLETNTPPGLPMIGARHVRKMAFAPTVTRLMLGRGAVRLIAVEGNVRPPRPDELPPLRLLTYGTSIVHGYAATAPHLCFVAQAAWRLGADLINLGVGGACYCEKEMGDYIAARRDWHMAVMCLSVNMRAFSLEEYTQRLNYIVDKVAAADTARPVLCVTLDPYWDDLGKPWGKEPGLLRAKVMRQVLRDAVKRAGHPNLHLLEGPKMLRNICGLTGDLVHPADNGMIQMGENLAKTLRPLVPENCKRN